MNRNSRVQVQTIMHDVRLFAATLRKDLPKLDLHGFFLDQVPEEIDLFLYRLMEKGEKASQIIYGGGTGKLRECVFNYLRAHPLVASVSDQGGSCVVLFL